MFFDLASRSALSARGSVCRTPRSERVHEHARERGTVLYHIHITGTKGQQVFSEAPMHELRPLSELRTEERLDGPQRHLSGAKPASGSASACSTCACFVLDGKKRYKLNRPDHVVTAPAQCPNWVESKFGTSRSVTAHPDAFQRPQLTLRASVRRRRSTEQPVAGRTCFKHQRQEPGRKACWRPWRWALDSESRDGNRRKFQGNNPLGDVAYCNSNAGTATAGIPIACRSLPAASPRCLPVPM